MGGTGFLIVYLTAVGFDYRTKPDCIGWAGLIHSGAAARGWVLHSLNEYRR